MTSGEETDFDNWEASNRRIEPQLFGSSIQYVVSFIVYITISTKRAINDDVHSDFNNSYQVPLLSSLLTSPGTNTPF